MGLRNNEDEAGGLWDRKTDERDCGLPRGLAWHTTAQDGIQPVCFRFRRLVSADQHLQLTDETGYRAVDDAIALSLIT